MTNLGFTDSSSVRAGPDHEKNLRDWDFCLSQGYKYTQEQTQVPVLIFICVTCILGLLGNGAVIWLLAFRMKRTHFTVYILNLAIADFGILTSSLAVAFVIGKNISKMGFHMFILLAVGSVVFYFAYSTSQFLLTAISIDRCVAGLFPIWYRCRRPKKLSTILCALTWLLSFLVQGICLAILLTANHFPPVYYVFLVNAVVCLPLTTVSTLTLFIRFCFKSQQRQRGKLLRAILLTLFFFLIFAFPMNVILFIRFDSNLSLRVYRNVRCNNVTEYGLLCASLNSFVNPLLYFLVGREKRGLCRENLRLILRRVFMEEEEACREEPGTQLRDSQKPPSPRKNTALAGGESL